MGDLRRPRSAKSQGGAVWRHAEGARPPTRRKYLGDFGISQPEQVLTFFLMK